MSFFIFLMELVWSVGRHCNNLSDTCITDGEGVQGVVSGTNGRVSRDKCFVFH